MLFLVQQPNAGLGLLMLEVSRLHTITHHSSGQGIDPSQGPLRDNTQHSQQTDIHAPNRIGTRNPSKRVAVDTRLYVFIEISLPFIVNF